MCVFNGVQSWPMNADKATKPENGIFKWKQTDWSVYCITFYDQPALSNNLRNVGG